MNYDIIIKRNSFKSQLRNLNPKLIIVDSNVKLPTDLNNIAVETVVTSEEHKDFDFYLQLINILDQHHINRNDLVMIVGGGVLIDVASFAASTYKRGIEYVNVPTTTLSMIDSSVGSKNGLNHLSQKNLIGNITDPKCVIIDIDFLSSLSTRHFNNGLAEAIKIGYLSNPQIIDQLAKPEIDIEKIIELSVAEKLKYVEKDKFDYGERNYLNFGHTFGHAIETLTNFNTYLHGEAVSIGMSIASGYDQELIKLLTKFNLPTNLPTNIPIEQLVKAMTTDKKNTSDNIKLILKNHHKQITELHPKQVQKLISTKLTINSHKLCSPITVNKSKSMIHRLLASALATKSQIEFEFDQLNDLSEDVIQSINVLKSVGATVKLENHKLYVDARNVHPPQMPISIYKSATTYRVFTPILCSLFGDIQIELDEQLKRRPHQHFNGTISGNLHQIDFSASDYQVDGSISSQFVSGYILAVVALNKAATITIVGGVTSAPYIDMTIATINKFGYEVKRCNNLITIAPKTNKAAVTNLAAEPDFSSLAFFIVYNKLAQIHGFDTQVDLGIIPQDSLQADRVIIDVLDQHQVDMTDCPDLLPILVGYGLLNKRGIVLTNIDRIKYKECDRVSAMITNFSDLNAIEIDGNNLIISPVEHIAPRLINSFGDHRIAMAATIIAKICGSEFIINDYTVVHKSFPMFFEQVQGGNNECTK